MQREIGESITSLSLDVDRCMQAYQVRIVIAVLYPHFITSAPFQVSASADMKRAQEEQRLAAARDSSEMLNVLQSLSEVVKRHLDGTQHLSPATRDVVQNIEEVIKVLDDELRWSFWTRKL
jgi:hypothetical protein